MTAASRLTRYKAHGEFLPSTAPTSTPLRVAQGLHSYDDETNVIARSPDMQIMVAP